MSGTASTTASLGGTQNRAWAADRNAYGRKMMEKMGWTDGAGLGKDGQGEKTHVRIKQRGANQALGAEAWSSEKGGGANGMANRIDAAAGQKSWMQTTDNFASLLSELGSTYGKAHKKKKAKKDKKKKKRKREQEGGSGSGSDDGDGDKGRAHAMNSAFSFRKANIRNKKVTGLSDKDMAALLGGAAPVAADERRKREMQARRENETEEERKARKAAKKARKAAKRAGEAPAVAVTEEAPSAEKKEKKDKADKKKKKKKKKKKSKN